MMVANPPKTERNAEIYASYMEDGQTLAQIAREFRISAGRVRQIINKQDYLAHKEALERDAERASR
jgi:Mor family transcriptional regulator